MMFNLELQNKWRSENVTAFLQKQFMGLEHDIHVLFIMSQVVSVWTNERN